MGADIKTTVRQLAKIRLDEGLIMSLYLDLRADPKGQRHYQTFLKKRFSELEKQYAQRSPLHGYLMADVREINRYLKEEVDSRARGLALFISQGKRVFTAVQTAQPFENHVIVSRLPYIFPLVKMTDDYAAYGVIMSDEKRARLIRVNLGEVEEEMDIVSDVEAVSSKGYETKKGRLGHSDERYRRHLMDQISKHAKAVLQKAVKFFAGGQVDAVLLMADNGVQAEFKRQMPPALKAMTIEGGSMDVRIPLDRMLSGTLAIFKKAENEGSMKAAREAVVLGTGKGGRAVVGTEATLNALQSGQAELLVVSDRYAGRGWKCANCLQMGSGGRARNCPFCQSQEVAEAADMKEELVELAIRRGARVEFYSGKSELDRYGGVGALLRSR